MNEAVQIVIGGLLQGSIFALLALGFFLVYRVTGVINLAQGAFCVLAALSMHTLENSLGWPALPAAVVAVGVTTAFGLAMGAWTFVSVFVALLIGGVELVGVLIDKFSLRGPIWGVIGSLAENFAILGLAIVGVFVAAWAISVVVYCVRGCRRFPTRPTPDRAWLTRSG